jgi:signal peptidase I
VKSGLSLPVLMSLVAGIVVVWLVRQWVWEPVLIAGHSMEPTLHHGQLAGVNKLAYHLGPPRRGDIVVVRARRGLLAKRIVGLPEEEISARDGVFCVNGKPLPEPYVQLTHYWAIAPGRVPADCFVIAGDNRAESVVAVVQRRRLVGRLIF